MSTSFDTITTSADALARMNDLKKKIAIVDANYTTQLQDARIDKQVSDFDKNEDADTEKKKIAQEKIDALLKEYAVNNEEIEKLDIKIQESTTKITNLDVELTAIQKEIQELEKALAIQLQKDKENHINSFTIQPATQSATHEASPVSTPAPTAQEEPKLVTPTKEDALTHTSLETKRDTVELTRVEFEHELKVLVEQAIDIESLKNNTNEQKKILLDTFNIVSSPNGFRIEALVTVVDSRIWIDPAPKVMVTIPLEEKDGSLSLGEGVYEMDTTASKTRALLRKSTESVLPTTETIMQHFRNKYPEPIESIQMSNGLFEIHFKSQKSEGDGTPETTSEKKLDDAINTLSEEEKNLLAHEMGQSTPLEFEDPIVHTSLKDFIRNETLKLTSGFDVPTKIKETLEKINKKLLLSTALFTLWVGTGSYMKPAGIDGKISLMKDKEIRASTSVNALELADAATYNGLSENAKRVYLYCTTNTDKSYVIVDKPRATMYLIGTDKKLIGSMPILLGAMKGEGVNEANLDNSSKDLATTPAGKYTIGKGEINQSDSLLYQGRIFSIYGSNGLAIHMAYPNDFKNRMKALATESIDDNRASYGCINVDPTVWDKLVKGNFTENEDLFILPDDDASLSLNPKTGVLENKQPKSLARDK